MTHLAHYTHNGTIGSFLLDDGEVVIVKEIHDYGYLTLLEDDEGREWYIAQNNSEAGEASVEYYRDLINHDPDEFIYLVGKDTLIQWALGNYARGVKSLNEWLDVVYDHPEELWASYDSFERDVESMSRGLADELGYPRISDGWDDDTSPVVYLHN